MQSTTLGPKLTFWLVSHRLVAASAPLRHRVLGCRFATSSGRRNYCRVFWPKSIQSTTLGQKLTFWVVSHHLVAASAPLRHRFLGCHFGTSSGRRNNCRVDSQNTCNPLLYVQSLRFGRFCTVWLPQVHHCEIGS